MNYNKS